MKMNLAASYPVGKIVNVSDFGVIRLLEKGRELDIFPGGKGVCEWEVESVPEGFLYQMDGLTRAVQYPMTLLQLDALTQHFAAL